MHSVQIIGSKGSGGAENFYTRLCGALQATSNNVLAITPPHCPLASTTRPLVSDLQTIAMRGNWDIFSKYRIRQTVKSSGARIVQTWMGRATRLTDLRSLPDVTHVARLGGYYNLKAYRHADAWVGNTLGICDYLLAEGLPADRVFHISNFYTPAERVDAERIASNREELDLPADALILFSLGRLHINKGFDVLLNAFQTFLSSYKQRPVYLLIAGDGPLRETLQAQAIELGIDQQIRWLGWQTEIAEWFQMADIFICPSRHEPLGNVVLEAWGNEVPVIASDIQGPAELIDQGETGLLFKTEDARALSRTLLELLADQTLATQLRTQGRARLESDYSVDRITALYLDLYQQLSPQR